MPEMPQLADFVDDELECVPRCHYCGEGASRELFSENGFPHVQCEGCSLIYLRIRVRQSHVHRIYDGPYHEAGSPGYAYKVAVQRLALLGRLPVGAKIVEDGAGVGAFVAAAREAGHHALGCDLGSDAIRRAQEWFGVELTQGALGSLALPPASVNAVASFNLLSHLYEPWTYMRQVAEILAPGGRWICRTGDRRGFMAYVGRGRWSAPEHVFHFTRPVLKQMVAAAGLNWVYDKPAFDSDFPYVLMNFAKSGKGWSHRAAGFATKVAIKGWSACGLPKEDIYFVAERR